MLSTLGLVISTSLVVFASPMPQGGLESAGLELRSEDGIQKDHPGVSVKSHLVWKWRV